MSLEVVSSSRAEALVHKRVFPTRVVVVPETKVMGNDAISEKQERTQVFCPLLPKTKAWVPSFHLVCILSYAWVCAFSLFLTGSPGDISNAERRQEREGSGGYTCATRFVIRRRWATAPATRLAAAPVPTTNR